MALQTFTAGQILTAAQVTALQTNDYNQTVSAKTGSYTLVAADKGTRITMSSASATTVTVNTGLFTAGDSLRIQNLNGGGTCTVTAGTATVTSAGSLVIPSWGGGQLYFTSASAAVYFPDAATNKVAQVLSTTLTSTFTTTSTSFTDVTGLTVSITPSATTSKIFVVVSVSGSNDSGVTSGGFRLARAGTGIFVGDAAGSRTLGEQVEPQAADRMVTLGLSVLDSPATTSATTYSVQCINSGAGTFYVNRSKTDTNSAQYFRGASSITVMEILA
jgi:hypothetical protein